MKKTAIAAVLAAVIVVAAGCQEGQKAGDKGPQVKLPPDVAGIWEAVDEGKPWAMAILEDGRLAEARIALLDMVVKPDSVAKVEMKDGQFSTLETGPAIVQYNPETRELTVAFDLKHFEIRFMKELLVGSARYAFTGPVSEDGKTWTTTFSEEFDYGPRFPMDPNGIGIPMNFRRVEPKKAEEK